MNRYELKKKRLLSYLKTLDLLQQAEDIQHRLQKITLKIEALTKKLSGDSESELVKDMDTKTE